MKTFAISIPKPCHEDWNKMTPDAKGAFCGSCQKSVYDFSDKSDDEIIAVFEKEEKGKVCGRFAPAQLTRPVISFGEVDSTSRLAKFLYALLLVFGSSLFIGANAFAQDVNVKGDVKVITMGKMYIRPIEPVEEVANDTVIPKTIVKTPPVCGTKIIENDKIMMLGEVAFVKEPEPEIPLMGDTTMSVINNIDTLTTFIETIPPVDTVLEVEPMHVIMGSVAYIETTIEPIPQQIVTNSTEEITEDKPVEVPEVIEQDNFIIEEEVVENTDKAVVETVVVPPSDLEVKVSPNPSRGEITLTYTLESAMPVKIDLYDITGKFVKTLTQHGNQYAGKYNVSYNISDLQNGIYFATLMTSDKKSSAKIILTK